uniref:Uncharacterized protein n=1 Tax=Panagrolaimus superbus TaxID=310955 RepID=A0A914YPZ8_9BILA
MTVEKTKEFTKEETSSKDDSSSDGDKQPPPSPKKHSQVKPRAIKSTMVGKERKKPTAKAGSRETKSREAVPVRKKQTLRRKH